MNTAAILAIMGAMIIFVVAVLVGVYVFMSIYTGKIFKKAGEKFWKGFIPYYSTYIYYKICWRTKFFWALFLPTTIVPAIIGLLSYTQIFDTDSVFTLVLSIISIIFSIAGFIVSIGLNIKLSWSFGHGIPFAIGLIFLPVIFGSILAFGKSEYIVEDVEKYGKLGF